MDISTRDDDRKVCPFDHHSVEFGQKYPEIYTEMRGAGSILWTDNYGGFWIATNYEYIRKVLMDDETFTTEQVDDFREHGLVIPTPEGEGMSDLFAPNHVDGQRHNTVRAALSPHFSKKRVAEMADAITERVNGLLDEVISRGEFDVVRDLASPLVAGFVSDHMGFDLDDPGSFFRACATLSGHMVEETVSPSDSNVVENFEDALAYLEEIVRARRANPRHDVISAVLQTHGEQFSDLQVAGMCMNLIFGAADTTLALTGHCVTYLADRPDLRARLRADPSRISDFILESLRYFNIAMGIARTARRDLELDGMQIRKGDRIFAPLAAANLDPAKFPHAEEFDLERGGAGHLALGAGSHNCLGQWVAKALVAEVVKGLLERVEDFSVTDKLVRNANKAMNNSFVSAPVRIDSLRATSEAALS